MAQSSTGSSFASQPQVEELPQGLVDERRNSPVPYRIPPLAYTPPVYCYCGYKAPRWISWSLTNPGVRYYKCRYARTPRDCSFFKWHDDKTSDHIRELLNDLKNAVFNLKRENAATSALQHKVEELQLMNQAIMEESRNKDIQLDALRKELDESAKKVAQIEHLISKPQQTDKVVLPYYWIIAFLMIGVMLGIAIMGA